MPERSGTTPKIIPDGAKLRAEEIASMSMIEERTAEYLLKTPDYQESALAKAKRLIYAADQLRLAASDSVVASASWSLTGDSTTERNARIRAGDLFVKAGSVYQMFTFRGRDAKEMYDLAAIQYAFGGIPRSEITEKIKRAKNGPSAPSQKELLNQLRSVHLEL